MAASLCMDGVFTRILGCLQTSLMRVGSFSNKGSKTALKASLCHHLPYLKLGTPVPPLPQKSSAVVCIQCSCCPCLKRKPGFSPLPPTHTAGQGVQSGAVRAQFCGVAGALLSWLHTYCLWENAEPLVVWDNTCGF